MSREAFHRLLQRYLDGNCTSDEKRIVEEWYAMLGKEVTPDMSEIPFREIERRLWNAVRPGNNLGLPAPHESRPMWQSWVKLSVAACLAALIIVLTGISITHRAEPEFLSETGKSAVHTYVNKGSREVCVLLEDNSSVVLQPGSSLMVPHHFSHELRKVFIEGEAFFKVSKNKSRPFLVYNKDVIVRVVGTSFTVRPGGKSHKTEVLVRTGKVIVTEKAERKSLATLLLHKNQVTVTPNQKAIYDEKDKKITAALVEKPVLLAVYSEGNWRGEDFVFSETPIANVLDRLGKSYGVDIRAESDNISKCTFTGDLAGQDLFTQLDFVCQSIKASYSVEGVTIIIKGKGCL